MQRKTFFTKVECFDLMNSKHLLFSNCAFIEMSRRTCFTYTKEEFLICV